MPGEESRPGEARGLVSDGTRERIRELTNLAAPSRSKSALHHTFANPGIAIRDDQWADYWTRFEAEFGLRDQPFAEAIHRKHDQEEHRHRVYSLLRESGTTMQLAHHFKRREKIAREFEVAHGLPITTGAHNRAVVAALRSEGKTSAADTLEAAGITQAARPRAPLTPDERHQQQRSGQPKSSIQAAALAAWNSSNSGAAFVADLGASGLHLAQGEKTVQIVDAGGGTHDLRRSLSQAARQAGQPGITAKQINDRLASTPISGLTERRQEIRPARQPRRMSADDFTALVQQSWTKDQPQFLASMSEKGFVPTWIEFTSDKGKTNGFPGFEREGHIYSLPRIVSDLADDARLTPKEVLQQWADAGVELRTARTTTAGESKPEIGTETQPASIFIDAAAGAPGPPRLSGEDFIALVQTHWTPDNQAAFLAKMLSHGFQAVWCETTLQSGESVGYPGFERDGTVFSLSKSVKSFSESEQRSTREIITHWASAGVELRTATISREKNVAAVLSATTRPAGDFLSPSRSISPSASRPARAGTSQQNTATSFVRGTAPTWNGRDEDWSRFVLQLAEFCASERARQAQDSARVQSAMRANAEAATAQTLAFIEQFRRDYVRAVTIRERMDARKNLTTRLTETGVPTDAAHSVKRSLAAASNGAMAQDQRGMAAGTGASTLADAAERGRGLAQDAGRARVEPPQLRSDSVSNEHRRLDAAVGPAEGARGTGTNPADSRFVSGDSGLADQDGVEDRQADCIRQRLAERFIRQHATDSAARLNALTAALDAANDDTPTAQIRQQNREVFAESLLTEAKAALDQQHPGRPPWSASMLDAAALAKPEIERLTASVTEARRKAQEARAAADAHPAPTGLRAWFSTAAAAESARLAKVAQAAEGGLHLAEAAMRNGVPWAENQAMKTVKARKKDMEQHQQKVHEHSRETQVLSQVWRLYHARDPDVVAAMEGDGLKAAAEQVARRMAAAMKAQREAQKVEEERLERERTPSAPGSPAMRRRA